MIQPPPTVINGFDAYAPDMAYGGGGFNPKTFADLAELEAANFWFRARNELILFFLRRYRPGLRSFLEIGAGTGYVLSGVADVFPEAEIWGSEIFVEALPYAAKRIPRAKLIQADARALPFKEKFEAIGAFDVLEHIQEDEAVLANIHRALRNKGLLLLTVPQHKWLWSVTDEDACHVRRYESQELLAKIEGAGFQILRGTSFVSLLLPAMLSVRLSKTRQDKTRQDKTRQDKTRQDKTRQDNTRGGALDELKLPPFLNAMFYAIMRLEFLTIRLGLNYPMGGSRLLVAQKADI